MSSVKHNQVGGKKKGLSLEERGLQFGYPKRKQPEDVGEAAKGRRTVKVKPAKMPAIKAPTQKIKNPFTGKMMEVKPAKMPDVKAPTHKIKNPRTGETMEVKPAKMPDIKIPEEGYDIELPKGFKKGSIIKGFPKLAKKGWK